MDIREEFENETGKDAIGILHHNRIATDEYLDWLEANLTALKQGQSAKECETFEQSKSSQKQGLCDNCRRPLVEH